MPPGFEGLFDYGTLGIGAVVALWFSYHCLMWLFSRQADNKGYVSQVIEGHIENQRAQKDLYRALVDREDKQQLLCETHAEKIGDIGVSMARHNMCAKGLFREACAMARTVSQKEWPSSADAVDRHCQAMERIIDEA